MRIIQGTNVKKPCKRCKNFVNLNKLKCPHCGTVRPTEY